VTSIRLVPLIRGLQQPVVVTSARDGTRRLFVCERAGRIVEFGADGATRSRTYLDIRGSVESAGQEQGLLGLAFPPDFATRRVFFVYYTATFGDIRISRFPVGADGVPIASGEKVILTIPHHLHANHDGGQLAFGPDGYLYIGVGDGGSEGDPDRNGQKKTTLLSKILRVDVGPGVATYRIPSDNPWAKIAGVKRETWAWGLRNPWRFSFDRATGDMYIGDVGQDNWEEIDYHAAPAPAGQDFGWSLMEGDHPYRPDKRLPPGVTLTRPIFEYGHGLGCAVVGGYEYRGSRYPRWAGAYFFGDYCSGRIWTLRRSGGSWVATRPMTPPGETGAPITISTFGEAEGGELVVADLIGGTVYRLGP
jgi:glucose/arabinose dehydrogenase